MISFHVIGSSDGALHYHRADLQVRKADAGEYYAGEEAPSRWLGQATEQAGFAPGAFVGHEDFKRMLDGHLLNAAQGGVQQVGRADSHRPGFDFTFSAPKSFSIAAMMGGDARLLAAHEAAVARAFAFLEAQAACRVRLDDKSIEQRPTGNLLAAAFSHDTSRELDPQVHTHVVVANATWDEASGKWRAIESRSLLLARTTADAIYKNELAKLAHELGYDITWGKDGPELAGITREQRAAFSKRSAQIKDALATAGKSYEGASAEEKQIATLATRKAKESLSREQLLSRWEKAAQGLGLDAKGLVAEARALACAPILDPLAAEAAVNKGMAHLSEREAAFSRNALTGAANQFARGTAGNAEIQAAIDRLLGHGELLQVGEHLTTPAAVALERDMAQRIGAGRLACDPVIASRKLDAELSRLDAARGFALNEGQRDAARLLLSGGDRYLAIQGYAGTGKTTMLDAVRQVAQGRGYTVVGMSAGAKQAAILERDSGIQSQTVASFLGQARQGQLPDGRAIWVVDEASQLSQRDTSELFRRAEGAGARVVFVGDAKQHQSVEAGIAFEKMQEAGIATARLTEINRQKDDIGKAAVADIVDGHQAAAFDRLAKVEIADNAQLVERLAKDYAASPARDNLLIVTARNADRQAINAAVRGELKMAGHVAASEVSLRSLEKIDLTATEAREAWRYEDGVIVQADRTYRHDGIAKGETFRVAAVDDRRNAVTLERADGSRIVWNPEQRTGFSAYQQSNIDVSVGDKLRFTRNDHALDVKNGETGIVQSIDARGGTMTVAVGDRAVSIELGQPAHVQHGYASTSYGAQGDTKAQCLYHINTASAGGLGDRDFYVGATRAREGTTVYTTDIARAGELVQIAQSKMAAVVDLSIPSPSIPVPIKLDLPSIGFRL